MNFVWTDEAVAQLRMMRDEKVSFSLIADALGCSRNAAIGKANRLGIHTEKSARLPVEHKPYGVPAKGPRVPPKPKVVKLPPPPPPAPATPWAEGPGGVSLMDLAFHHCRWPMGALHAVATHFCGKDKRKGSSYCDHHHRLAFRPRGEVVQLPKVKRAERKSGLALRYEVGRI